MICKVHLEATSHREQAVLDELFEAVREINLEGLAEAFGDGFPTMTAVGTLNNLERFLTIANRVEMHHA